MLIARQSVALEPGFGGPHLVGYELAQAAERDDFVPVLRPILGRVGHDARRFVSQPNCRLDLVPLLAAGARVAAQVDPALLQQAFIPLAEVVRIRSADDAHHQRPGRREGREEPIHATHDNPGITMDNVEGRTNLATSPAEGEVLYQKIRDSLQKISDLEVEHVRLAQFFAMTNTMFTDPSAAAAAVSLAPSAPDHRPPEPANVTEFSVRAEPPAPAPAEAPASAEAGPEHGSEDAFEEAFVHSLVPLAFADGRGAFVDANARFSEATGFTRDEVKRLTIFSLVPATHLQDVVNTLKLLLNRDTPPGTSFLLEALAKPTADGSRRRVDIALSLAALAPGRSEDPSHIALRVVETGLRLGAGPRQVQTPIEPPDGAITNPS